jgi:hypothetical protein
VTIIVVVFIGARLMHSATPAPIPAAPGDRTAFNAQLALLEARPVNLSTATSEADCPATPNTNPEFDYGSGPVFGNGGPQSNTAWGYYWDVTYYPDPSLSGPVLIRGRDLITGETLMFSGQQAAGPLANGVGQPAGWHTEAVVDPASKPTAFNSGHGGFHVRQALTKRFIGCFGIQIDGPAFTEKITGFAAP